MKEVECNCGWCAMECHQALQEGKSSSQVVGILCMIAGFIEMWAGGVAYSISSSQDIAAGAWWAGMVVFLAGFFGMISTFQCFKIFKIVALVLG